MLRSAQDGTLQAALTEKKSSSSAAIDALRVEARDSLLRSAKNGTLEAAFRESKTISPINPMTVMSFDEMDLNHDGKIDKDEWERAVAKVNARASPYSAEENEAISELQDTIAKKDAEINALKELLRSSGHLEAAPKAGAQPGNVPFRDYYSANFHQLLTTDLPNLYSKFPAKPKPKTSASPPSALNKTQFAMLPSVGTWLAKPCRPKVELAEPLLFNQKPSVATWFAFRPSGPERPRSVNIAGVSQEKLVTMKAEDLVHGFQKEINRRDEEIKRLKQMLNLS